MLTKFSYKSFSDKNFDLVKPLRGNAVSYTYSNKSMHFKTYFGISQIFLMYKEIVETI